MKIMKKITKYTNITLVIALGAFLFNPMMAHAKFLDYVDPFGIFHNTSKSPEQYYLDIVDPLSIIHSTNDGKTAPVPAFSVGCSVSRSTANVNDTVVWTGYASGGAGSYSYSWSGTDGLSGSGNSISRSYSSTGAKYGTLTVTSNGASVSTQCSNAVVVGGSDFNNLDATCYPNMTTARIGENVDWYVSVNGGTGSYSYYWNGTDGLNGSGQTISRNYNTEGTKTASVTVISNNQTITRNCNNTVGVYYNPNYNNNYNNYNNQYTSSPVDASCRVNTRTASVGEQVVWTVIPTGGNGYYNYSWEGDDGIYGNTQNVIRQYNSSGQKRMRVTITSGGSTVNRSCGSVEISGTNYSNNYSNTNYVENTSGLRATCRVNKSTANIGSDVLWSANVSGGNGNYIYSWSGTDGVRGNSQDLSVFYDASGVKRASVIVTSGNQEVVASCTNGVTVGNYTNTARVNTTNVVAKPVVNTATNSNSNIENDFSNLTGAAFLSLKKVPFALFSLLIVLILIAIIAYMSTDKNRS